MDLSRLSTLSLNNSNDIIANNISLINGNKTDNILDLFVLKNEYEFTEQIFISSFYDKTQTYTKLEIINLFNSGYNNLMIDNMLSLKQNVITSLNIDKIDGLQANLDSRATITNMNNNLALKQNLIGIDSLNINQING